MSGHLETLRRASEALDIPVIASLNGTTSEGWVEHARSLEQAGAAAIELNVYSIPVDLAVSGAEVERGYVDIVRGVRASVRIPDRRQAPAVLLVAGHMAAELVRAGADGLVLFNRFYAPDIDLLTLRVTRSLPLSTAAELPLTLVWIALLSRRLACSLGAGRGVETDAEVVKYLLVGADVVMTASALLRHGPEHVATMREGLERWLGTNGFDSVDAIRGLKDASHVEQRRRPVPRAVRRQSHRLPARQARLGQALRTATCVDWLRTLLETSPMTTLFLVIAAGYLVGEINVKGFALGSGAVLFVGLACGAFAPKAALPGMLGTLGLLLFLYCVGVQYGGDWYRGLKSPSGLKANVAACCGLAASAAVALVILRTRAVGPPESLGIFAGATTSTPALQAVLDALGNQDAAVGYSLAYPFGVAGPILCMYVYLAIFKPTDRRSSGPVDEAGRGPCAERDAHRTAFRRSSAEPAERRAGGGDPQRRTEPRPGCRPPSSRRTM